MKDIYMKKWLLLLCVFSIQSAQQVISSEEMQQRHEQLKEAQEKIKGIVQAADQKGSKISSEFLLIGAQNTILAVQLNLDEKAALLFGFFNLKIERHEAALDVKYYDFKNPEIGLSERITMTPASETVAYQRSKKCSFLNFMSEPASTELKKVVELIVPILKEVQ